MILLAVAILALLLGFALLRRSQHRRRQLGLPNGDVFYQDHSGQPIVDRIMDVLNAGRIRSTHAKFFAVGS